jgi:hypothetical protein
MCQRADIRVRDEEYAFSTNKLLKEALVATLRHTSPKQFSYLK